MEKNMGKTDAERQAARRIRLQQQAEKLPTLERLLAEEKTRHEETRLRLTEARREIAGCRAELSKRAETETAELKLAWMRGVLDACSSAIDLWAIAQILRNTYLSPGDCSKAAQWYKDEICVSSPNAGPPAFINKVFDSSGNINVRYLGTPPWRRG
jgi:hypothetical protein